MLGLAKNGDHAFISGFGGLSAKEHKMLPCTR